MTNFWSVLLALGFVQGVMTSVVLLLFQSANKIGNRLLAIIVFLFSLLLLEEFAEASRLYRYAPKVLLSTFTLDAAFGPLIYLYTLSACARDEVRKKSWHLWPVVIASLLYIIFHLGTARGAFDWVEPQPTLFFIGLVNIKILYLACYFLLALNAVQKFRRKSADQLPQNNRIQLTGLNIILWIMMASTVFIYFLFDLNVIFPNIFPPSDTFTVILITISIYTIVFIAIRFPFVFTTVESLEFYEKKIQSESTTSYKTSSLTIHQKEEYLQRLLELMVTTKPFHNQQLKAEDVAELLGIPVHHLSQVINEILNKNFYEFINYYRVEEVKEKMFDPKESHKSLLGIAMDAGFNSKATFNRAFKEFTGLTPTAYREKNAIK